MAGRIPKPTSLKVIEGNRGKRATNKQEPDPEYLIDLEAPAWLPASAKEVWQELAPNLARAKLLTKVDADALAMGCVAISQHRYAVKRIGDDMVKSKHEPGKDGEVVAVGEHINPWMFVQSMSFKQVMLVFQQFGMTPAARTRIAINPQADLFGDGEKKSPAAGYFG